MPPKKRVTEDDGAAGGAGVVKSTRRTTRKKETVTAPEDVAPAPVPYVHRTEDEVPEISEPDFPAPEPTFEELYQKAARAFQNGPEEAWTLLVQAAPLATTDAERVELANLQAAVLFRAGRAEQALQKAREALALDPRHVLARQNEITLRLALGQDALESLQPSVEQLLGQSLDPATLLLVQEVGMRYFARRDLRGLRRGRGIFLGLPSLWRSYFQRHAADSDEARTGRQRMLDRFVPLLALPLAAMPLADVETYHQRLELLLRAEGTAPRTDAVQLAWNMARPSSSRSPDDLGPWRQLLKRLLEIPAAAPWERTLWETWYRRVPKPRGTPEVREMTRRFLGWLGAFPSEAYAYVSPHLAERWRDPVFEVDGSSTPLRPLRIGWVWHGAPRPAALRVWKTVLDAWSVSNPGPVVHHVYRSGGVPWEVPPSLTASVKIADLDAAAPGPRLAEDRLDVCVLCDWTDAVTPVGWGRYAPRQLAWGSAHRTSVATVDGWLNVGSPEGARFYEADEAQGAAAPLAEARRSDFGLPAGVHVVAVPHRASKLTPRFLSLCKLILAQDPFAVLLLQPSEAPVEQEELLERLGEELGPFLATRVRFVEPQPEVAMYLSLLQCASVVLLPPACEAPRVLHDAARARTCVVLSAADTPETCALLQRAHPAGTRLASVATSDAEYVAASVRFLQDPSQREVAVSQLAAVTRGSGAASAEGFVRAWEREIWKV